MVRNMPLKGLIQIAYQVRDFQITGAPAWISSECFDVEAYAENPATWSQMQVMAQSLLADRFNLKLHRVTKESAVYALVLGKNGLRMKPSADQTAWSGDYPAGSPDGRPLKGAGMKELSEGRMMGTEVPLSMFANLLSGQLGRPVINRTGLTGRYDVELRWTPDAAQTPSAGDSSGTSIFTAIQEQLGLRLEAATGPVEMLVIDHVEKPSAN